VLTRRVDIDNDSQSVSGVDVDDHSSSSSLHGDWQTSASRPSGS